MHHVVRTGTCVPGGRNVLYSEALRFNPMRYARMVRKLFFHWAVLEQEEQRMNQPRFSVRSSDPLPREMVSLQREVARLPEPTRNSLQPLCRELVETFRRRRRVMSMAHEALSQLRLEVKYLMFDLDATREEKRRLQQQLDENAE